MFYDDRATSRDDTYARHADCVSASLKASGMASRVSKIAFRSSAGPISALVSEPRICNEAAPPLLALHGISRDVEETFDAFRSAANEAGRVLIAPEFSRKSWRVFQRITDRTRPDVALLEILTMLRDAHVIDRRPLEVFGFSGGAQLAHRWAMLYPHVVAALHICSAGWYTSPRADVPYPYGLQCADAAEKSQIWPQRMTRGLDAFLRLPISIYVGEQDCREDDAALRRNAVLDAAQGCERRMRARNYLDALLAAAKARSIEPVLKFHELPGCGHGFAQCAGRGSLVKHVLR